MSISCLLIFFVNAPATTEIYTLSLHDALPIYGVEPRHVTLWDGAELVAAAPLYVKHDGRGEFLYDHALSLVARRAGDRKSTRLNSSHPSISYAVFCLKKKK